MQLRNDIKELEVLLAQAARPKVQGILNIELRKLQTEYISKEEKLTQEQNSGAMCQNGMDAAAATAKPTVPTTKKGYKKEITTYGICFVILEGLVDTWLPRLRL